MMTLKNDNDKETECALGLSAKELWQQFSKIDAIGEKLEAWEKEEGILFEMNKKLKVQNGRIGRLEKWRWIIAGAAGVIIFLFSETGRTIFFKIFGVNP